MVRHVTDTQQLRWNDLLHTWTVAASLVLVLLLLRYLIVVYNRAQEAAAAKKLAGKFNHS